MSIRQVGAARSCRCRLGQALAAFAAPVGLGRLALARSAFGARRSDRIWCVGLAADGATLIALLQSWGLSWLQALLITSLLSLAVTGYAIWRVSYHTGMHATRRQLSRLGLFDEPSEDDPDADGAARGQAMKFGALQRRVKRCEQVVTVRLVETQDHWSTLGQVWRQGWSPLRIVVVGLAGGFIAGKLEMPGKVNGARWLQMVGSVSNLFASAQAAFATAMAAQAAPPPTMRPKKPAMPANRHAAASAAEARPAAAARAVPEPEPEPDLRGPRRPRRPPSCPNVDPESAAPRPADNALPPADASMSESSLSRHRPATTHPRHRCRPRRAHADRCRWWCWRPWPWAIRYGRRRTSSCRCCLRCSSRWSAIPSCACCRSCGSRALGALLILGAGLGVTGSLAVQLIGPAMEWAQEAPQQLRKVARQVQNLTKPVQQANQAAENFARVAGGDSNHKVQVIRTQLDDPYRMLTRAPRLAASVLAVVLLTLFFMIYGQSLQRAAIALFPNRQQQRYGHPAFDRTRLALRADHQRDQHLGRAGVRRRADAARYRPAGSAAVGHGGRAAEFCAVCGSADRRGADAVDGLRRVPRPAAGPAARSRPGPAHWKGRW